MKAIFINPFTDFGFKKIFGEEASKPLLIDFLNVLLPQQNQIKDLSFRNPEQLGIIGTDRKAIYDIYCENSEGEKFIVELQKAKQNYFKERTIYYSTFPIRYSIHFPSLLGEGGRRTDEAEQAEKGDWNYNLKAVFCIGILDFTFDDYTSDAEQTEVVHTVKLKDQNGKLFYDKLTYIYLEMPNFDLSEQDLKTRLDKWLFFIKHLENFQSIPSIFENEVVFIEAFHKAELSKLAPGELENYENSLKVYRDLKNVIDTAKDEGRNEGRDEGRRQRETEIASELKRNGVPVEIIIKTTGLSENEINQL